jgi:hypothetical protein
MDRKMLSLIRVELIYKGPSIHDTPLYEDETSRFLHNIDKFIPGHNKLHTSILLIS